MNKRTEILLEGVIMAALAMALHFVPLNIGPSFTLSLGQIPMTLFALRRGLKPALYASFIWAMLYFVTGAAAPGILTPIQGFIEYPVAFTCVGFAGICHDSMMDALDNHKDNKARLVIIEASLVGVFARFFWHFIAGGIFWGAYAPKGMNPWIYSIVMNGISALASGAAAIAVLLLLYAVAPSIYRMSLHRTSKV